VDAGFPLSAGGTAIAVPEFEPLTLLPTPLDEDVTGILSACVALPLLPRRSIGWGPELASEFSAVDEEPLDEVETSDEPDGESFWVLEVWVPDGGAFVGVVADVGDGVGALDVLPVEGPVTGVLPDWGGVVGGSAVPFGGPCRKVGGASFSSPMMGLVSALSAVLVGLAPAGNHEPSATHASLVWPTRVTVNKPAETPAFCAS
jgi:hypothetical protein